MGTVTYLNIDSEIVSETRSGTTSDYLPVSLGSTIGLLNSSQTLTDTWTYWPYGETASRTGTNATAMQFVGTLGYHQDTPSRTYIRARFFRPPIARWQTVDPLWPTVLPYSYADSGPILVSDPSGLGPKYTQKYCDIIFDGWKDKLEKQFLGCLAAAGIPPLVAIACLAACLAPEPAISKTACVCCVGIAALVAGGALALCINQYDSGRDKADQWKIRCYGRAGVH